MGRTKKTIHRWAILAVVGCLSGCQSLYIHNAATQQATATAKTEFDKLNVGTVFDNEAAYLDDLQKREYAAVADSLIGQRDDSLSIALHGKDDSSGRSFLKTRIDGYLKAVAGTSDRGGKRKLWRDINNALADAGSSSDLAQKLAGVLKDITAGTTYKAPDDPISKINSPSNNSLAGALKDISDAAAQVAKQQEEADEARTDLATEIQAITQKLSAGKATQDSFKELVDEVHTKLAKAQSKSNPYLGKYLSVTLEEWLDHLVDATDTDPENGGKEAKARAAIGFVQAAFGVGDAFSNPPRVPHPNALASARSWLEYTAQQSQLLLEQQKAKEGVQRARLVAVALQVYYLSHAGDELGPIGTQPVLEVNQGLDTVLSGKDRARSHAAAAALYYYSAAWTRGFIPDQQLKVVTLPLAERRAKLQSSRASADAWVGVLKPAVATLAAYGEGGIDPHSIAELLQALGIGAIAVGVN